MLRVGALGQVRRVSGFTSEAVLVHLTPVFKDQVDEGVMQVEEGVVGAGNLELVILEVKLCILK